MSKVDVDEIAGMAADLMSQPQNVTASLSPNFWRWSALRFAAALPVLVAERDALRAALKAVEWEGTSVDYVRNTHAECCPRCGNLRGEGHAPDCALAFALAAGAEKA